MGDYDAVGKENVLIRAGSCVVSILPHLGAKIASIRYADQELLQAPLAPYAARTQATDFAASDASGWDECLPSVSACTIDTDFGPASIPDHGDLWRVAWETVATSATSAALRGQCFSLPLSLERTVSLAPTANGVQLSVTYKVTNTGDHPAPWSWAAHPLFAIEAGDRIVLPDSITTLQVEGSAHDRLGKKGSSVDWPNAVLANPLKSDKVVKADLSLAVPPESGIGDKLFAGPLAKDENWASLERTQAKLRIKFSFDSELMPYLGLWICFGGWPDAAGPKQMCVAIEPTTAPTDSLAITGPWSRTLAPGEIFSWPMTVNISNL